MNFESNYDTINRSFLIAQNSDKIQKYLNEISNLSQENFKTSILLNNEDKKIKDVGESGDHESKKTEMRQKSNNRYPLENSWSFWFYKNSRNNNWSENLIHLTNVDNVQDFWSVYTHLKPVEYLSDGCDYAFFKKGIKPMWEDANNLNGERWIISIQKRNGSNFLNYLWLNALLSLIGSHYDDEIKFINGIVISIRFKCNKFALWTNCHENKMVQNKILKRFKKEVNLNDSDFLFEIHKNC
ncbi:eukaryotic translation initiation factor 4E type 1B [Brachionus plicatilis]|uniref:Eukaryotic translation initiation factor 4E type 1B n=1 Tax=Brachionus plicatilis TaxID=10195 RepID=A0A3M7T7P9_BRAPC|nr:eukaryotic translation initiation factor 4E type 1B [Brachionus plicatilis]